MASTKKSNSITLTNNGSSGSGTVIITTPIGMATYTGLGSTYSNITVPVGQSNMVYTSVGGGGGGTWTATTSASMTNPAPRVKITDGDIELDGVSIAKTMVAIQERLAILQPKPELLEKYEALKQAYDHYKMLEALCMDSAKDADK